MSELQFLIRDQIKMYEHALNNLKASNRYKNYYERNRKEALTDLLEVQLDEFDKWCSAM